MANVTSTGFTGTFESPGTVLPGVPGSGTITINGAADATWLQINYEKGEAQLSVQMGSETFYLDAGSTVRFSVAKPQNGVSIHYEKSVKGTWSWLKNESKGS